MVLFFRRYSKENYSLPAALLTPNHGKCIRPISFTKSHTINPISFHKLDNDSNVIHPFSFNNI